MLESDRQAYLSALGITQYVTLAPFAGAQILPELTPEQIWAAESLIEAQPEAAVEIVFRQVEEAPPPVPSVAPTLPPTPERATPVDDGAIPQLDVGKLKQEASQPKSVALKPVVKAQRFALAVVTVPDQYRLWVELALPDAPGLSALEHRMMSDLLASLGQAEGLDRFGAKLFRWPLVDNPRIAADSQAARDGLLGFVASAPPAPKNVFLGNKASAVLSDVAPGQPFNLSASAEATVPDALATWSLADMVADWTRKQTAWQVLHPFLLGSE